ncbi:MAG TPA: cytidine deaminase [Puia sp.]|jgi:cytidine deaminase|nr:cytidine deaminase [Puia sp.]
MQKREFNFSYEVYDKVEELSREDAQLLDKARAVTKNAYAPYSRFRVGAMAKLENGQFISGTNQENASFPVGICAERVLLSTASSLYPGIAIDTLAISYFNEQGPSDQPISPCGICRQSLQEFGQRTGRHIRLILGGQSGKIYILSQASLLLPLAFTSEELK